MLRGGLASGLLALQTGVAFTGVCPSGASDIPGGGGLAFLVAFPAGCWLARAAGGALAATWLGGRLPFETKVGVGALGATVPGGWPLAKASGGALAGTVEDFAVPCVSCSEGAEDDRPGR